MADIGITVHGLDSLRNNLSNLTKDLQEKVIRPALQAAGSAMLDEAQRNCPVDDSVGQGALRDSLEMKTTISPTKGFAAAYVHTTMQGPVIENSRTSDPGIFGTFVEFGLRLPQIHI